MRIVILGFFLALAAVVDAQTTEEKTLITTTGELKGTLYLPKQTNKLSLVIIQAGSGATDRNGNSLPTIKANSYKLIAESLAVNNIATLLMDKRGIAGSFKAMTAEKDLRFDSYSNDLAEWVRLIKKDNRFDKIFLAGHSEGSLVAMLAAQIEKVNGYISLAGAGESIDKIIVWQYKQQLPKVAIVVDSLFARIHNNQKLDSVPPMLMSIFRPSVQPYIASWIKYNPCIEIAKLKMPVLIIQGTTDLQVQINQANMLHNCKPKATYALLDGMNHILKEAPIDQQKNIATYSDINLGLHKDLIGVIVKFINTKK